MFPNLRSRLLALMAALAVVLGSAGVAEAAWVTIKNDTGKTIVVQETIVVNGKVKRGKPTNLLPGETIREFIPGPTTKTIDVFDAQNPRQPAWSGNLNCKDEAQTFSVSAANGKVTVSQVANPPPKK
jgi:hypothetical protein